MTIDDLKTLLDFHYWARDRALAAAAKLTPEQLRAFVDSLSDPDVTRTIEFRTPDGTTATSLPIGQMVQHVVNHASYHRGQLTMMFRQLGVEPADSMDLIRYYREQSTGV